MIQRSGVTYGEGRIRTLNGTLLMTARFAILNRRTARQLTGKLILSAMTAIALAGCAGQMQGTIRDDGTPVEFFYEQGAFADTYIAEIDGEHFSGRAVMVGARSTYSAFFGAAYTTTGHVQAIMLGNQGSTLRCRMQYADSSGFTTPGGVGECVHSDGRAIDVVW